MTDKNWKEDEWNQGKHCQVCNEPMLLPDRMKVNTIRNNQDWQNLKTCSKECRYKHLSIKYEYQRQFFSRPIFNSLVRDFREALGFDEADTESTFNPWDLSRIDTVEEWKELAEWDALLDYVFDLRRDFLENVITSGYYKRKRGRDASGIFFFMVLFERLYREEFYSAPTWALDATIKSELKKVGIIWHHLNERLLFDRMKSEIYPDGLTFSDWASLCSQETYVKLVGQYEWMPTPAFLFYGSKMSQGIRDNLQSNPHDGHYDKIWDFVNAFRMYMCRDSNGRFTTAPFSRIDCLVHQTRKYSEYNTYSLEWNTNDFREWFFTYLLGYYDVQVDRKTFPYKTSEEDMEAIINLRVAELDKVKGFSTVYKQFSNGSRSIRNIVSWLWPKYEMVQTRWNRMLLSEKLMSSMLDSVLTHNGISSRFSEATSIPSENGKARYEHSNAPMKVDFRCESLKFIVEGQGEYHYMQDEEKIRLMMEGGDFVQGLFWSQPIPDCYQGNETTRIGYRQFLDREKRESIVENGYSPIYVILADIAYAVEGVHGDIPVWNRRYVSDGGSRNRYKFGEDYGGIGLAETFDMQGREDVGDMIRKYHNDVVMRAAASS